MVGTDGPFLGISNKERERTNAERDARILLKDLMARRGRRLADEHARSREAQRSSRTEALRVGIAHVAGWVLSWGHFLDGLLS